MPLPRRAGDGIIDFSHVLCLDILHRSLWLVLAQHGCLKVLGVFLKCLNMQKTIAKSTIEARSVSLYTCSVMCSRKYLPKCS